MYVQHRMCCILDVAWLKSLTHAHAKTHTAPPVSTLLVTHVRTRAQNIAQLEEVAYFDVEPNCNYAAFDGTWSNFLFPSGKLVVTSKDRGLFTMKPRIEELTGHIK